MGGMVAIKMWSDLFRKEVFIHVHRLLADLLFKLAFDLWYIILCYLTFYGQHVYWEKNMNGTCRLIIIRN